MSDASPWLITALLAAAVAVVVAGRVAALAVRRRSAGPRRDVGLDPRTGCVWRACDSARCAHLQTEHDVLAPGRLMCRRCDRVVITTA